MDAPNPSALPTFASRTPLRIGTVGLIARDLDRLTNYYRDLLGLTVTERTEKIARLGTGGVTLLEIEHRIPLPVAHNRVDSDVVDSGPDARRRLLVLVLGGWRRRRRG